MDFYTGDWHNYDPSIIMYEHRPFKNCEEMRNTLIRNWNSVVGQNDTGYMVGDIGDPEILSELNGHIVIIAGNHDNVSDIKNQFPEIEIFQYPIIDGFLILSHEPIFHIPPEFPYLNVHGHLHGYTYGLPGTWEDGNRYFNVGVELNNYYPVSRTEMINKIGYRACLKRSDVLNVQRQKS